MTIFSYIVGIGIQITSIRIPISNGFVNEEWLSNILFLKNNKHSHPRLSIMHIFLLWKQKEAARDYLVQGGLAAKVVT